MKPLGTQISSSFDLRKITHLKFHAKEVRFSNIDSYKLRLWRVPWSICKILQARILEWVAMPSSRETSPPRDGTCFSCTGRQISLPLAPPGKPSIEL